jgi:hypothetical protein
MCPASYSWRSQSQICYAGPCQHSHQPKRQLLTCTECASAACIMQCRLHCCCHSKTPTHPQTHPQVLQTPYSHHGAAHACAAPRQRLIAEPLDCQAVCGTSSALQGAQGVYLC